MADLSAVTLEDLEAREADLHRQLADTIAAKAKARPAGARERMGPDRTLKPDEAAALVGMTRRTILREARAGRVPSKKVGHRTVRFSERALLRWSASRER